MPYLMHIGFDNSCRLCHNVYYFEYNNIRYKLIQNDCKRHCDVLLTIIDSDKNKEAIENAYTTASEFLSALSWQNSSRIKVWLLGGFGRNKKFTLKNARSSFSSYPKIPFGGLMVGYDICVIPHIQTQDQRNALLLFRDASSSNHDYLSFLFYWQILEINNRNPGDWINNALRRYRNKIRLTNSELSRLPLNGKTIGNYFLDDCRHAIAHFNRKPGKVQLKLDTAEDNRRISISTSIIKEFARFYITSNLKLNDRLYLVRKNGRGFPFYINDNNMENYNYQLAYNRLTCEQVSQRKWH